MAASRFSPYVWATSALSARVRVSSDDNTLELLAPFTAFMVTCVVASAFKPHDQWLYALKVIAIGGTLWWFRGFYVRLLSAVFPLSVLAGIAVGVAWIATDPLRGVESPLGPWLAGLPVSLAVGWVAMRALGPIVLVPIAEELAFRGYLCRTLMSLGFANLSPGQLRWTLIVSSVAFGVLHERWLAAMLSGAVYAALLFRTNRLSDPIAAHMASNGVILLWSVGAQQ